MIESKSIIPHKTIERLAVYRRELKELASNKFTYIYSHQLAELANNSPAQVRRDLMFIGCSGGNPKKGYDIANLIENINKILPQSSDPNIAVVGMGKLGKAILSYSTAQNNLLRIKAGFDINENIVNSVNSEGTCPCYTLDRFPEIVEKHNITIGILTVPAKEAQTIADLMSKSGIKGIVNFAPVSLKVNSEVYLERIDITMIIEKVSYFADKL